MGFRRGSYAKIWKVEQGKGNYMTAQMSVSKKNKETGQYDVQWSDNFVKLIGKAAEDARGLSKGDSVKIGECDVTNRYDKEKGVVYTNYAIFSFDEIENKAGGTKTAAAPPADDNTFVDIPEGVDSELPFN